MRSFQHARTFDPVPGALVTMLSRIDRGAGAEGRHTDQVPQLLVALAQAARIESVTASSAIEGVVVDDRRRDGLLQGTTRTFRNRSEAEYAGYRAALDYLHLDEPGELSVGLILHLHRLLFSATDGRGGAFKRDDNLVVGYDEHGRRTTRFTPTAANETPHFVSELVERTNDALRLGAVHPLLVVSAASLDLLCIHPFADGNGRVTRLVTNHLLTLTSYGVVRYVSLEQLIYDTKDDYYRALAASTSGWFDDGHHQLWPWATYLLERLAQAYDRFEARVSAGQASGTKQDRVRDFVLLRGPTEFRIADIRLALPGISDNTIRLVLTELKAAGQVANDGTGRSATWRRRL